MKNGRRFLKYFSNIHARLVLLALVILALNVLVLCYIDAYLKSFNILKPLLIVMIPFFCFMIYWLIAFLTNNKLAWLTHCKYNRFIPFLLYPKLFPVKSKEINVDKIKSDARPGDIILRRYNYYIDSIVFSENSYFTHVGICNGEGNTATEVLHCTAKGGVHSISIAEFCQCDHIAILRFSLDESEEEKQILGYINEQKPDDQAPEEIIQNERKIFELLQKRLMSETTTITKNDSSSFTEYVKETVLSRAVSLKGKIEYDFNFNFRDFTRMSCVEYVWYCFKCIYPLHRIKEESFEFFDWVKLPVIIPDVFIKNDFFKYVYASIPGIETKPQLISVIDRRTRKFLEFLFFMLLWNIIFHVTAYFLLSRKF